MSKVQDLLRDAAQSVSAFVICEMIWNDHLTAQDRQQLNCDLEGSFRTLGTIGIWKIIKQKPADVAVVEIARAVNLISSADAERVLADLAKHDLRQPESSVPEWNEETGVLQYAGMEVARFRLRKQPTRIQKILDAFQNSDWPTKIGNPDADCTQSELHDTLNWLNSRSGPLRFRSQKGGRTITWEIT